MANPDAPAGLKPVRHYRGGLARANAYRIASEYGTSIFRGDLVKGTATGKEIAKAGNSDTAVGVFAGCQYTDETGEVQYRPYWPAGTTVKTGTHVTAWVYDDPDILFEIQADADIEAADIGAMSDTADAGGDTMNGTSGVELSSSGIAASSKQLKIIDLVDRPDNAYGTNAKVLVLINKHELSAAMTAV